MAEIIDGKALTASDYGRVVKAVRLFGKKRIKNFAGYQPSAVSEINKTLRMFGIVPGPAALSAFPLAWNGDSIDVGLTTNPATSDGAAGFYTLDGVVFNFESSDFAVLDNVYTHGICSSGITPGHCIMSCGAAAFLQQCAKHRVAAIQVHEWHHLFNLLRVKKF